MKKVFLFLFVFFIGLSQSYAVQLPRALGKEKRFRTYVYNPNDVYRYVGYYLNQSYIEFEEGEVIQTISMGDPTPWLTNILGNKLFLKPTGSYPQTTMTIFTNKRYDILD
jgi:type IV secretion system protein VirB9